MNFQVLGAIFRKDVRSLLPLVMLTALIFLADALVLRLDLLPAYALYDAPVLAVVLIVLILSVFQLDSAASLDYDWLCRPVGKSELLAAKFLLVLAAAYLPHAIGTFTADVSLGFSLAESFLDALLLPDNELLFLLPFLVFIAIITRTLVQGFGVLLAIFICVIVIPTPFLRPAGPLSPGIRDDLYFSGMQWLAFSPAKLASFILVAVGIWLVYWRRRLTAARVLMALTVCVSVLLVLSPTFLMPWNKTFAIQTAFSPAPAADTTRISLRNPRACFPATRRAELSTDTAFVAAARRNGLPLWGSEELHDVGSDSVAFLTQIEPRGLPYRWRSMLNYVQAEYTAGGKPIYSLRPANYFADRVGSVMLAHGWMLPEPVVERLRGLPSELTLTYSLTLLKPTEHSVLTDGKRHTLPGLGYCSAELDESGSGIDVDCFPVFTQSAQISAQLNEISASRDYGPANFAPPWTRWPYGRHVKLRIGSPRLAKHDSITVIGWDAAGTLQKSLTMPGILGGTTDTCPLPAADNPFQVSRWRDSTPHEVQSITVDGGVQLEVLDFGGAGSPILLLPGLGATAHSYDELAPLLAQKHHVIAMTRRGTGYSSKPDFGFETPRLAQDVLEVMNAMKLERVALVGHSIAGEELTWLGGRHPDRFSGLVYLDAAYDRSGDDKNPSAQRMRELGQLLPQEPPYPPEALLSFDAMTKMLLERGHLRLPEGELIAGRHLNDPYLAGSPSIDGRTQQAIEAALQPPEYAAIGIPALAIYAIADPNEPLPSWYDTKDREMLANVAERNRIMAAVQRENIELFRRTAKKGQVLEMPNSRHYIVQSNQQEVLEAIEKFVAGL